MNSTCPNDIVAYCAGDDDCGGDGNNNNNENNDNNILESINNQSKVKEIIKVLIILSTYEYCILYTIYSDI